MQKISTKGIFFIKWVYPLVWLGFLAFFAAMLFTQGDYKENLIFLIVPFAMAVFGYFFMKKTVWNLADEVYDCGDSLLVRNRGTEEIIALSNILNISISKYSKSHEITLRLENPGMFGSEISFCPKAPFAFIPFSKNLVFEDLAVRIDEARMKRAR
jgi:hypothetical protein